MEATQTRIDYIKNNGYELDFSNIFNKSIENYKKIALNAGLAFLLLIMLLSVVSIALIFASFGINGAADALTHFDVQQMEALWVLGYIGVMLIFTALMGPFYAGLIKMAHDASTGENFSLATAFAYYGNKLTGDIIVTVVLISFFSSSFSIGLEWAGHQWIGVVLSLLLALFTCLAIPLVIFGGLKPMEAIKGSMTVVSKQPLIIAGLMIVACIFIMLGLIAFCIGILFTMPFIYSVYYILYADIIGNQNEQPASHSDNAPEEY